MKKFRHIQTRKIINGILSPCGTIIHMKNNRQVYLSECVEIIVK